MEYQTNDFVFLFWMLPAAYLLGSVPTAVWTGRLLHGIDIREHGSGNAGATNVMRVLGVGTGLPVLLVDLLKGLGAVLLIHLQSTVSREEELFMIFSILLGVIAITGHIFPLFAQFRGGKGVATMAGVCFALHPLATISAVGVFVVVLLIWKYVSAGSMAAGLSFPFWVILVYNSSYLSLGIFSIVAAILLILTHRANIIRLIAGEESKASFLFRKKR
jgi:acyl phosphate:glycerol-3-phosphate acyltransferase